jgi:peroxiredoxin
VVVLVAFAAASTSATQTGDVTAKIPPVVLSHQHEAMCKVKVGDALPAIELPRVEESGNGRLADLLGEQATVVVFWSPEQRMALEQLADMSPDVVEPFGGKGVAVVGIAVNQSASDAEAALKHAGASFPNLLDAEESAFASVGTDRLPRTYLLDSEGKILWFDIEYSLATRRDLHQALRALVGEPASAGK